MRYVDELELKDAVRARDGHKCVDCGATAGLRQLDVHRLVPGSLYTIDGTVTVCRSCHKKRHAALNGSFETGLAKLPCYCCHCFEKPNASRKTCDIQPCPLPLRMLELRAKHDGRLRSLHPRREQETR